MKVEFVFSDEEIALIKNMVDKGINSGRKFIEYRLTGNVHGTQPPHLIDDNLLWKTMVMCLLTTQQRSGPGSSINQFLNTSPFPLSLDVCRKENNLNDYVIEILSKVKGIRRYKRIAKAITHNLKLLDDNNWVNIYSWRDKLLLQRAEEPIQTHRPLEEEASNYVDGFHEFGPKQSRNFWQSLGLTRYVFVLDGRVIKWLNKNLDLQKGVINSQTLSNYDGYQFASHLLVDLCQRADILPCILDAVIFDSFDEVQGREWVEDVIM